MTHPCPECGAVPGAYGECQAIFDSFLAHEFSDPAYGEVHFLTVACFMIQHGRYSDEALAWIEEKLRANLHEGITAGEIRRQAAREARTGSRSWKVKRPRGAPPLPEVAWSLTIVDVAAHCQDDGSYCAWLERWAQAILREMHPLIAKRSR